MSFRRRNLSCQRRLVSSLFSWMPAFAGMTVFIFSSSLQAELKIDQKLPIQIQSDKASFERLNRQAVHEGNVVMVQGNQTVYADKLIVKKDIQGKDTLVNAIGNPAIFLGKVENEPEPVRATAKMIHYYPDKQLIILEGDAQITHLQDKFQGPMLSYQLDKQIVTASKHSKDRPTITIQPRPTKKS